MIPPLKECETYVVLIRVLELVAAVVEGVLDAHVVHAGEDLRHARPLLGPVLLPGPVQVALHPQPRLLPAKQVHCSSRRKEGSVLFNDALNTFYLRLYGVRHMVKEGRKCFI